MCPHNYSPRAGALRRSAFTLIELLVVIAIIGILATLTSAVVIKFMTGQPVTNTRVGLQKIHVLMRQRWVEVTEQAKKEPIQGVYLTAVQSLSPDPATQRVIYIKIKQKQALPETFTEALSPIVLGSGATAISIPPVPGYVQYLKNNNIAGSSSPVANYESAACMLMALQRSTGGRTVNVQDLGLSASVSLTIVPGNVPCLVDGWGNPIGFCRWPLGNTNAPASDTTDPGLLLWKANNWNLQGATNFANAIHVLGSGPGNLTPVLASSGAPRGVLNQILNFGVPGSSTQWKVLDDPLNNAVIYSNTLP